MPHPIQGSAGAPGRASNPPQRDSIQPPSGHVYRAERKRGPVWYAKYRLPDGRQVQRKLGPAWTQRGRPPAGYYTKRQAETGFATCSIRRAVARCRG
jgi:hypothetical protein